MALLLPRLPAQPSFSLAPLPLHFDYVRGLKLRLRQHEPQHFNFDLTREGLDFSIWKIDVANGLSRSQYECMRQMVEDELNTQVTADLMSRDALSSQEQGQRFNSTGITRCDDLTAVQQETCVRVVAMYDAVVEDDTSTDCELFFCYPVGKDPTVTISMLRRKDDRLLALPTTVPVVEALQDAGAIVPGASSPAPDDIEGLEAE